MRDPSANARHGLDAQRAAWRLLLVHGVDLPLAEFQDSWPMDGTMRSLRQPLEHHALPCRGVRIVAADLAHLALPTLVQLRDDSWLVVRARRGRRLVVETCSGIECVAPAELAPHLTGNALERLPSLPGAGSTLLARCRALLISHRRVLVQFGLASLLLQALALATPELTSLVMGRALPDGAPAMARLLAAGVVVVALFTGAIAWFRERVVLYLLTQLEVASKHGLLAHVLRLPFPELQRRPLGELLQAFYGISAARTVVAERALGALFDGVLALSYLLLMGSRLLVPTLVLALGALAMAGLAALVGRAQARLQEMETHAQSVQRGYLTELIAGVRTVKAAGAERQCHARWGARFAREQACTLARQRVGLWSDVGIEGLRQAFSVTLLLWGGYSVLQGEIGVGPLFGFLLLGEGFLAAVLGMVNAYLALAMLRPLLVRAEELLATPTTPRGRQPSKRLAGPIVMNDVWFRYTPQGPWVLKGYDLRVEPGERLMLDGPSGSGKSTILRLLAGLHAPESGTISVNARELRADPQRMLYLPQFVQLYCGSVLENLRILSGGAPTPRLLAAARATRFDAVVEGLAMGYETILPHGGATLSGGQRQMLALTAMLASDYDVLLLDEPMANLDPHTQAYLADVLADAGKTIVSAGHY
jgi:ABC-type bacteriocin/lantibiotic exporter with double-glycine peptidase domain